MIFLEDKYLTITQLNRYIKFRIDQDANLNNVFLKGEISNFKAHTRGHLYFTLKDENSRINAVMFQGNARNLKFSPMDGMKVLLVGKVSVYESSGSYQIYVQEMLEDGVGNLAIEFEKLKKKLASEGLFDPSHKRKIPKIPKRIGVVTASTGAAIKDILTTIKRRWPIVEVILFPSLVQGASASSDIVRQINRAQEFDLDTLIVGRGGGSIEDLWCFNDEEVARAIYNSRIPVISGVGHEIDFTIADFVADLRAPTPTAAAELAVPNKDDFYSYLRQVCDRLNKSVGIKLKMQQERLKYVNSSIVFKNPMNIYLVKEEKFDRLFEKFKNIANLRMNYYQDNLKKIKNSYIFMRPEEILINKKKEKLELLTSELPKKILNYQNNKNQEYINILGKLEILNPLLTIKRGYSVVRKDNRVIDSVKKLKKDDKLELELKDGKVSAKVI